jgi:hypothetical protein
VIKNIAKALMLTAGLLAMVALAVPASASPVHGRAASVALYRVVRVGHCSARGDFATCVASGNVNKPTVIYASVYASPNQHVSGDWSMTCTKGTGAGSKSGTMSGTTPLRHRLRMPYVHPDSCSVAADAQLSNGGRINVTITAHV